MALRAWVHRSRGTERWSQDFRRSTREWENTRQKKTNNGDGTSNLSTAVISLQVLCRYSSKGMSRTAENQASIRRCSLSVVKVGLLVTRSKTRVYSGGYDTGMLHLHVGRRIRGVLVSKFSVLYLVFKYSVYDRSDNDPEDRRGIRILCAAERSEKTCMCR